MRQFDVQRIESLMRYAEFLRDMKATTEKVNQVIEVIHEEVVGYIPEVNETQVYADNDMVQRHLEIHPLVQQYVQQEIKNALNERRVKGHALD